MKAAPLELQTNLAWLFGHLVMIELEHIQVGLDGLPHLEGR
jgi:hypothetical protein